MALLITNRAGKAIRSFDEWHDLAPPASATHWKPGRSAYELARAWMCGDGAARVAEVLALRPELAGFRPEAAKVEAQTRFDKYPGGARNHDLMVVGSAKGGRVVVSVEAKADETFGETVAQYRSAAQSKVAKGVPTNALDRLDGLISAIAGGGATPSQLDGMRYQLFSATAGALAAAKGADAEHAVVFVHVFATPATTAAKLKSNEAALADFLRVVFDTDPSGDQWCAGPFNVPGSDHIPASTELWLAKAIDAG